MISQIKKTPLEVLGKRRLIRVDARRLDWDGLQGAFCSKYRDICKKSNAADRPSQVIARHDELICASLDINHPGFALTNGHTQVSFALVQEGGVEEFPSDDVVVNDNTLYGTTDKDAIYGLTGNDALTGGAGTITDSDGQGTIQIDGQTIGTAKGAGKRNVWVAEVSPGQYVGMSVYDNQSSSTGKKLVITRAGSTDNTITINNFDLYKAL